MAMATVTAVLAVHGRTTTFVPVTTRHHGLSRLGDEEVVYTRENTLSVISLLPSGDNTSQQEKYGRVPSLQTGCKRASLHIDLYALL